MKPQITLAAILFVLLPAGPLAAQRGQIAWSGDEQPVVEKLRNLRKLPDDQRGDATRQLAFHIRKLPASPRKLTLAVNLANLSTEGDFGSETLLEVARTLAIALRENPPQPSGAKPAPAYVELAQLVRYEHVDVSLDDPRFRAALANLEQLDARRAAAGFTLSALDGKEWTLGALRGKVVLVNFWATWCPPCRKEMPDLQALYEQFRAQGLVILAITDEETPKVRQFLEGRNFTYPILLDPARKANQAFEIEGIPKSFVFDRDGKLVAQAIDMRTRAQFLDLLERAGLR